MPDFASLLTDFKKKQDKDTLPFSHANIKHPVNCDVSLVVAAIMQH